MDPNSGGLSGPGDLTFGSDGNLYIASVYSNSVLRFDGSNGAFIDTFVAVDSPIGVRFGFDGNLYVASFLGSQVLRYQGPSGATPGAFVDIAVSTSDGILLYPTEITFDAGGTLYVSSWGSNSVVRSGVTSDFYRITADGNKTIEIQTTTPSGGSDQFVNGLDPMLQLYDAAGNLLASNDNGASDGRNAKLSYKVPKKAGGSYYLEVTSAATVARANQGEYVLSVHGATGACRASRWRRPDRPTAAGCMVH